MTPEEVITKSAAINARRDTKSFTQMVSAFCRHETPTLPPHDPPADLDDMNCLRLLTTTVDRFSCPLNVGYVNRLKNRRPEELTELQRLVVWVDAALCAGERLITTVAIKDQMRVNDIYRSEQLNHKLTVVGDALRNLFADYQMFANSGDAGHWSLEDQPCGQQALAALELLNPTTPETTCTESP